MKSFNLTKISNFSTKMPNVNLLKRKEKIIVSRVRYPSRTNTMSNKTKDFIQKICYKKSPTADMTRYGFANPSSNFAYVMFKPLKAQLEKIFGYKQADKIIIPRRRFSDNSQRTFLRRKSKKSVAQYSYATNYSGGSRSAKSSSIQAEPQYIYKPKKRWG